MSPESLRFPRGHVWRMHNRRVEVHNKYTGERRVASGAGFLNPTAPGGIMSPEVNKLRIEGNPTPKNPYSLPRAIYEAGKKRIKSESQSPLPEDSED